MKFILCAPCSVNIVVLKENSHCHLYPLRLAYIYRLAGKGYFIIQSNPV
jgi:hypothetical protein